MATHFLWEQHKVIVRYHPGVLIPAGVADHLNRGTSRPEPRGPNTHLVFMSVDRRVSDRPSETGHGPRLNRGGSRVSADHILPTGTGLLPVYQGFISSSLAEFIKISPLPPRRLSRDDGGGGGLTF